MSAIGAVSGLRSALPQVVSGASMRLPAAQKMGQLFQKIDTSGSGSITKAQLSQALQTLNPPPAIKSMGADALFSRLDPRGTGSVSKQAFITGMKPLVSQGQPPAQTLASSTNALNALGNKPAPVGPLGNTIDIVV